LAGASSRKLATQTDLNEEKKLELVGATPPLASFPETLITTGVRFPPGRASLASPPVAEEEPPVEPEEPQELSVHKDVKTTRKAQNERKTVSRSPLVTLTVKLGRKFIHPLNF
jgi:hypothetical protein